MSLCAKRRKEENPEVDYLIRLMAAVAQDEDVAALPLDRDRLAVLVNYIEDLEDALALHLDGTVEAFRLQKFDPPPPNVESLLDLDGDE